MRGKKPKPNKTTNIERKKNLPGKKSVTQKSISQAREVSAFSAEQSKPGYSRKEAVNMYSNPYF